MSFIKNKKFIAVLILFLVVAIFSLINLASVVYAETSADTNSYNFTLITNENGEQSYQVDIKATAKPTLETAIVPETYNGLNVTQIANNGFMSCEKLTKVVLPKTIKKIGNNEFMNCQQLERLGLPAVESIGTNAFALCSKLDRMFIPKSVKTVGANILRNNENTVYIQSSEDEINSQWQSTWSNYYTGNIVTSANPEDVLIFREIMDTNNENVIGYEITENQNLVLMGEDIVIYNSYKTDENGTYLPLLNICPEAFFGSFIDSITFKDRHEEDETAPLFNHAINIRSNAFICSFIDEVNFEINITFNHPQDLITDFESSYDGEQICGDSEGHSIKVFTESTIKTMVFPQNISFIPEKMFYNASYLSRIEFYENEYDENNKLCNIQTIGKQAFSSCVSLSNIYITSSTTKISESAFEFWGENLELEQSIYIDFYKENLPVNWSSNWANGINISTAIVYKQPTNIQVDLQDTSGNYMNIGVKPGVSMPEIEKPIRNGYQFKGIYSGVNGTGYQYYTDNMQIARIWNEGDVTTLYVYWEIITYTISYFNTEGVYNPNPITYTVEDEINFINLQRTGYVNSFTPNKINKGTTGNINIYIDWTKLDYQIEYDVDLKGCTNSNPELYSITDEITFVNLEHEGYDFEWIPSSIPFGSTGRITIRGIWTPKTYNINYVTRNGTTYSNPITYNYDEEIILSPATLGGYFVEWDRERIPLHSMGDITIRARYTEKTLEQCYTNGIYEIWTWSQMVEMQEHPDGGNNKIYRLMASIYPRSGYGESEYWTPIPVFKGEFDGNGYSITQFRLDSSSGGNIGFVGINEGTIKNLRLATYYFVDDTFLNVNVGAFAGINNGSISDCEISSSFISPIFRCYAKGNSYAGGFVGINNNKIENCIGTASMQGNCDMGGVAGKNTKTIKNCQMEYMDIDINYYNDHNSSVGGIVGIQSSGSVTGCFFNGFIELLNYQSSKYPSILNNPEIQPMVGIIIGRKQGGSISGNSWGYTGGRETCISVGSLSIITYNGNIFNQALYFKNEECGRVG